MCPQISAFLCISLLFQFQLAQPRLLNLPFLVVDALSISAVRFLQGINSSSDEDIETSSEGVSGSQEEDKDRDSLMCWLQEELEQSDAEDLAIRITDSPVWVRLTLLLYFELSLFLPHPMLTSKTSNLP